MYGTVFRMKVIPGKEPELAAIFQKWERERRPQVAGAVGSLVLKSDRVAGEFWGVAVFQDKRSYTANAGDSAQDQWYRQLRALLAADPEWNDGDYIYSQLK